MIRHLLLVVTPIALSQAAAAQTTSQRYAETCRTLVGPLPEFSCADGIPVPVTVDGVQVKVPKPQMECDRPSLLDNGPDSDGQCVPHSRILSLSTEGMMVAVMCRQKVIRDPTSMEFDEIDVIAHDPATGATCWFQATGGRDKPVDGSKVPSPTAAMDSSFWSAPEIVARDGCGNCHDNDPFMFSPFVGQVWREVPVAAFGPYFHVGPEFGFDAWPTKTFAPRDNTCLGCHRIGQMQTCGRLTRLMTGGEDPEGADPLARQFPLSHTMPPGFGQDEAGWNIIYGEAVAQIESCCAKPDQPACALTPLPETRQ
jgi:hypothetical protein